MPELTNCRFCDGEVSTTAQKCKHCGEWLTNKANSFDMQPQPQNTFILSCAFSGLLFIAALSFIFKGEYIPSLAAFAMSLILLPYFANVISNRYSLKIQKWHKIFVCILMLIIIGATSKNTDSTIAENPSQEQDTQQESTPQNDVEKVYQVGDTAKVGYMTYKVNGINWQKRIGDQYFGCDANSNYLAVDIAVQNNDKQSRMVPAFTLVDQNGNKYQAGTMHNKPLPEEQKGEPKEPIVITKHIRLSSTASNGSVLIISDDEAVHSNPNPQLIKAIAKSFYWNELLLAGTAKNSTDIQKMENHKDPSYIKKILKLRFLAPDIIESILNGTQRQDLNIQQLFTIKSLDWVEQKLILKI